MTKKLTILIPIVSLLITSQAARAATLYFEPAALKLGVGDSARVEFLLDSPESVNAVEGVINYPADLLEIKNISDGSSVINFWITRPEAENGKIIFAGVIPGGYTALRGKIIYLDVVAKKAGTGSLSVTGAQALLNNGQGTADTLNLKKVSVYIGSVPIGKHIPEPGDRSAPEGFVLSVIADNEAFGNDKVLVFSTQDKDSGIAYYEVAEGKGFFAPKPTSWAKATSPYILKDQELKSWVFVRAVDNEGNVRMEILSPINRPWYQKPLTIGIVISLLMLGLMIWRRVRRS